MLNDDVEETWGERLFQIGGGGGRQPEMLDHHIMDSL